MMSTSRFRVLGVVSRPQTPVRPNYKARAGLSHLAFSGPRRPRSPAFPGPQPTVLTLGSYCKGVSKSRAFSRSAIMAHKKKIIVCTDGTWMNSDNGTQNQNDSMSDAASPVLKPPSNVTRIARCVSKRDRQGNDQVTYYQSGIGTHDILDKLVGGATGMGLSEHIREGYSFIAQNYNPEAHDEIYLIGFSRGSFTARSIAAFISDVGLLTPAGMVHFYPIFEDWENQLKKGYKTHFPDKPFASPRPNIFSNAPEYTRRLVELGLAIPNVKIKAVACYDTVGALGLPRIGIFDSDPQHRSLDYSFIDTRIPSAVEHAIHALALDERREPFAPTMWEQPEPQAGQTLTQCWFSGGHADVGGSYDDTRNADITLAWMISQLSAHIDFDLNVLRAQYYQPEGKEQPARPWACGQIHDAYLSNLGTYFLGGIDYRTPMAYNVYDHDTGREAVPAQPLRNTNELMHSSVRLRSGLGGKGPFDKGDYNSRALEHWVCRGVQPQPAASDRVELAALNDGQRAIHWEFTGKSQQRKTMPEALLGPIELDLLRRIVPSIEGRFLSVQPKPYHASLIDKAAHLVEGIKLK